MDDSSSIGSFRSDGEAVAESFLASTSKANIPSVDSISTFSSIDKTRDGEDGDSDDDIYEKFNGSTADFATAKSEPVLAAAGAAAAQLGSPVLSSEPLNIAKTRDQTVSQDEAYSGKFAQNINQRVRSITPVTQQDAQADAGAQRLAKLEAELSETETKHDKLTVEIEYVKRMLRGTAYDSPETRQLEYALGKLEERKLDAAKRVYELGVKIATARRLLNDSSNTTDYFVRKASLEN